MTAPNNHYIRGDFRNVREKLIDCVACDGPKDQGLLICWACHRRERRANAGGYSDLTLAKLALAERACQ